MFLQYIASGISIGMLYGLTALGLSILYKTTGLINFAHGEMAMFTTFISFALITKAGVPFALALLVAALFAFIMGTLIERGIFRRGMRLNNVSQIILTISLYSIFRGLANVIWGNVPKAYPKVVDKGVVNVGKVVFDSNSLFIIAFTLLLMGILYFFFRTRTGLAMRAVSMNRTAAKLMGIKVEIINYYTWGIVAVLGALAGMLIAPTTYVSPTMMGEMLTKAFCAAVLGGFSSMPGVVIGGIIIGILENLIGGYITAELKSSCIFLLMIILLAIKPSGLFGKKVVKKV